MGVSTGSGGTKRSFIRGGGAIGGAILRIVCESSREGGAGRRSGESLPWFMLRKGARAGILVGLLVPEEDMTEADMTELDRGFPRILAPKFVVETGVFALLGG